MIGFTRSVRFVSREGDVGYFLPSMIIQLANKGCRIRFMSASDSKHIAKIASKVSPGWNVPGVILSLAEDGGT
jgi:hypothetical protein